MSKRRITYPGSVYARNGYLYISFKGSRHSTRLKDTQHGRRVANAMLEKMWHEFNALPMTEYQRTRTVREAYREFLNTKISRYPKTINQYKLAYNNIISEDYTLKLLYIEQDVQQYIARTKHSPVTINTYLTLLQIFLNYATEQGWVPYRNLKKIYKKKEHRMEPEPYTDNEVSVLLGHLKDHNPELGKMVGFMLETGARVVDCLTLTPDRIKPHSIIWLNKITKKPEERPISARAVQILASLPKRPGQVFKWQYSTSSRLNRMLITVMKECHIERKGRSFQEFRTTFRMRCIKKGMPEIYIEYLLRHSRPDITAIHYTTYKSDDMIKYLDNNERGLSVKDSQNSTNQDISGSTKRVKKIIKKAVKSL